MFVLRKDDHVPEATDTCAHSAEMNVGDLPALDPEIHIREGESPLNHGVGESYLPIKLERSCVDGERARCSAGLCDFIDDADTNAAVGEPQRKRKAGWSGAGDQNIGIGHEARRSEVAEKGARRAKYILHIVDRALPLFEWTDPHRWKFIRSTESGGRALSSCLMVRVARKCAAVGACITADRAVRRNLPT
jgi:hypothetical protein